MGKSICDAAWSESLESFVLGKKEPRKRKSGGRSSRSSRSSRLDQSSGLLAVPIGRNRSLCGPGTMAGFTHQDECVSPTGGWCHCTRLQARFLFFPPGTRLRSCFQQSFWVVGEKSLSPCTDTAGHHAIHHAGDLNLGVLWSQQFEGHRELKSQFSRSHSVFRKLVVQFNDQPLGVDVFGRRTGCRAA